MNFQGAKIDLHVHTSRGSPCAEIHDPETIPKAMEKAGIQGVVITEHNSFWSKSEIKEINKNCNGKRIYRGIEVTTDKHHYLVIGVDNEKEIYPGIKTEKLIKIVKKQGGAIILAHPFYNYKDEFDFLIPENLTAIEIVSTLSKADDVKRTKRLCKESGLLGVAGSDAHCSENLGKFFTIFPYLPENEKELAKLLSLRKRISISFNEN
jgi:predicted metal-dependent phosphoesterase TrpH